MLNEFDHRCMSGGMFLVHDFEVQRGEHGSVPAGDRAVCFTSGNERLRADKRAAPQDRRPKQGRIAVYKRSLCRSREKWRRMQLSETALCFFQRARDFDAFATRAPIDFKHYRKPDFSGPSAKFTQISNQPCLRNANSGLFCEPHKAGSLIHDGETLGRAQRAFN